MTRRNIIRVLAVVEATLSLYVAVQQARRNQQIEQRLTYLEIETDL